MATKKRGIKGPWKFTEEKTAEIAQQLEEYCQTHTIPVLQEFAFSIGLTNVQCFYEVEPLIAARERLIMRKAANLEIGGLANKVNPQMAIFLLKQLGYSEKSEITHNGVVQLVDDIK